MKSVFKWIIRNLWNLFGVIGVAGTFYFSLLHVPDYVKEIATGKVNVIHESLMNDIQEILFYEKELSIEDISSFIEGKELKQGIKYPYNPDELLVQIQERFMGNKFISLEKREALLHKIKSIRETYTPAQEHQKKPFDWIDLMSWFASGLGVLIAILGATSIVKKVKLDKETEVDIVPGDISIHDPNGYFVEQAHEYEKMVGEILKELGVLKSVEGKGPDMVADFITSKGNNEYIVKVKRYKTLVGLGTARNFLYRVNKTGTNGILVVSSGATHRTKKLIEEHNEMSDSHKVHLVVGESKSAVKKALNEIFETGASNKTNSTDRYRGGGFATLG